MARNDHSGYPLKWFKDQNGARQFHECALCLEVLKDTVQVRDCGHQFCALCIDDVLKTDPRCPNCRIEISNATVFEDHAARRLIKQLDVNCCNEGCNWNGNLSSLLQDHQKKCNFSVQNVHGLKVEKLEQEFQALTQKVLTMVTISKKYEQDVKELKLKYEQDIKDLKIKYEQDIKEIILKHAKDVNELKLKSEEDIKDLKLKYEQDIEEIKLKHENDVKELELKLQQSENRLQRLEDKEKESSEDRNGFIACQPLVEGNVKPVEVIPEQEEKPLEEDLSLEEKEGNDNNAKENTTLEPLKKKSSKRRFKDINKKTAGGDLMDAFADKPPPQEPVVEEKPKPVEVMPEKSEKPLKEELSWEDKEEKIGEEIKVENETEPEPAKPVKPTRRKYDRDFLLQLQFMQVCTEKPAGLPNIEVVLDSPISENKFGGSQRGGSDFLPSYARQKSQGGGGRRDSRGKPPPRKVVTAAPGPPVVLKKSENPWLRPKLKEKDFSEEEKKTAELYRNVMAILNKLTPQKFKTLVEQMMALSIDTSERLEGVIERIFEKAIREPMYSVAYANLCRCLFGIRVANEDGRDVSFWKLFMNQCQKGFEKEKEHKQELLEKFSHLDGLSEEEKKVKKEEIDDALAKNKRRMLGNMKFIGELFKLKLLTENIMHDCVFKLLRAGDEESLERLCKLLFTIGKVLDTDRAKPRMEQYFEKIGKIIAAKKISSRVIFMLRDLVELRDNKWVPRREDNYNPKTIDQIHKEARMEKMQKQRLTAQMPVNGGRDSPKPPVPSNDDWITTGKAGKSVPIDQNKLRNLAKRANNEEISLGPSSRFGQWVRGRFAGFSNSSQPYDPRGSSSAVNSSSSSDSSSDEGPFKKDKARKKTLEAVRRLNTSRSDKHSHIQRNLTFSPSGRNAELLQLLQAEPFERAVVTDYIETHFEEGERKEAQFIRQLVTAVAESCIVNKGQATVCCQDKLKARKDVLRKYLRNDVTLEVQALFALQQIYVKYNEPAGVLSQFFHTLYDEAIITEKAFMIWISAEIPSTQEGKQSALQETAAFINWLLD